MNFRTQLVDGKPRIFFDSIGLLRNYLRVFFTPIIIDDSSTKTRSKRNSRAINRLSEQKTKINNPKYPPQRQSTRPEQSTHNKRVNEDGSGLGVYMTMDELAELVNAVKENAKSKTSK
jgi:hypothetical protein